MPPCFVLPRLKAELESLRLKNDASLSSVRSNHDAEICRLQDQLAESDCVRQQQIERLQYEHAKQLEELHRELANISERSESTRRKLEREKNSLEAELTKALQDLVTVRIVAVDSGSYQEFDCCCVILCMSLHLRSWHLASSASTLLVGHQEGIWLVISL